MTVNPVDVQINALTSHLWMRYDLGAERCSGKYGYHDCSGYSAYGMNAARRALGLPEVICYLCDTFQFEALGRREGLIVPVQQAIDTRGMWVGYNDGDHGHMANSLGDGRQIAARSHALDLGIWPIGNASDWEWGMRPPGIPASAFGLPSGPNPPTPTKPSQIDEDSMILCEWKHSSVAGRVCYAILDKAGKCVWLKNGAAIWGDQPDVQDKTTRKWMVGVSPEHPKGVPVGVVMGMAPYFKPNNHSADHVDGVCVATSDGGTFVGLFT